MGEHSTNGSGMGQPSRAMKWLSHSLASLFDTHAHSDKAGSPPYFDVVIVGSGYGGAIAAAALAGDAARRNGGRNGRPRIAILERGSEYLPGSFPTRMAELPRHVRYSTPGATEPAGFR